MARKLVSVSKLVSVVSCLACVIFSQGTALAEEANSSDTQQQIRDQAKAYEDAFQRANVDAIARMWVDNGVYSGPGGVSFSGLQQIRAMYKNHFDQVGGKKLKVSIKSIKPMGDAAIEEGVIEDPERRVPSTEYTVVHVKKDGQWKIASVSERLPSGKRESLDSLAWLTGKWQATGKNGTAKIQTDWSEGKRFIFSRFLLTTSDGKKHRDLQIIGVDPVSGAITSWIFDSEGGVGKSLWSRKDKSWSIKTMRNVADGTFESMTQRLTPVDSNSFKWQSLVRRLDGVSVPAQEEIQVRRMQ